MDADRPLCQRVATSFTTAAVAAAGVAEATIATPALAIVAAASS